MDSKGTCKTAVGIIGSQGRMGSWLLAQLRQLSLNVVGTDKVSPSNLAAFTASCDIVILAIPSAAFSDVTKIIGSTLRPENLLIDVASLKENTVRDMLDNTDCEVIGAHPMFGPSAKSFRDQLCYICPARTTIWLPKLEDFLISQGSKFKLMSPEKHDRLMATVQTLRHVMITSMGLALRETGFDISQDSEIAGEWFQVLTRMMTHQFDQPSELYADLAINNRHAKEVLELFREKSNEVIDAASSGQKSVLLELMEIVRGYSRIQ